MRGYLIDPAARTITGVDVDPGDLDAIYRLIGCDRFAVATFNDEGDGVYVDDEGLLKGPTDFFLLEGFPTPFAGVGLVLGCDLSTGSSREPTVDYDWLVENIDFGHPMKAGDRLLFMGERHIREVQ